ncbi:hypothetical protein V8C44DRAFT_184710 [Trichoderma aethiopicum]
MGRAGICIQGTGSCCAASLRGRVTHFYGPNPGPDAAASHRALGGNSAPLACDRSSISSCCASRPCNRKRRTAEDTILSSRWKVRTECRWDAPDMTTFPASAGARTSQSSDMRSDQIAFVKSYLLSERIKTMIQRARYGQVTPRTCRSFGRLSSVSPKYHGRCRVYTRRIKQRTQHLKRKEREKRRDEKIKKREREGVPEMARLIARVVPSTARVQLTAWGKASELFSA